MLPHFGGSRVVVECSVSPEEGLDRLAFEHRDEIDRDDARLVRPQRQCAGQSPAGIDAGVAARNPEAGRKLQVGVRVSKSQLASSLLFFIGGGGPPDPFDKPVLLALAGLGLVEVREVRPDVERCRNGGRRKRMVSHDDVEVEPIPDKGIDEVQCLSGQPPPRCCCRPRASDPRRAPPATAQSGRSSENDGRPYWPR